MHKKMESELKQGPQREPGQKPREAVSQASRRKGSSDKARDMFTGAIHSSAPPAADAHDPVATEQRSDDELDTDAEDLFRDPPEGCVRLRPSGYNGIPATVFIEYPPDLGMKRSDLSVVESLGKRCLQYNSYWERICIKNAFRRAGFEKSDKSWTALWSKHQNPTQMKTLNCLQKVNHFSASW
jgi:hypothetical protein